MEILQVNTQDLAGGAERIAMTLDCGLRERSIGAQLIVGRKHNKDGHASVLPNNTFARKWQDFWRGLSQRSVNMGIRGIPRVCSVAQSIGAPGEFFGLEKRNFPGSHRLLSYCTPRPDLVHFHNLHGDYFDLRALVNLSDSIPVVATLHDAWMLSGHCGHAIDCDRWKIGCGHCPDLTIYPSIKRDATRANWQRKANVFSRSKLHIATPCRWLMDRVEQSMLEPAVVSRRIIPNGVDISILRPLTKSACRRQLAIPNDLNVVMFAANGIRHNPFKDFKTLRAAMECLGTASKQKVLALAVGEPGETEQLGNVELRFVPFIQQPSDMVPYYCASDLYLHPARMETFGLSILEAMACGTPVIATDVGGIPEFVKSEGRFGRSNLEFEEQPTGVLVPVGGSENLSHAIQHLLGNENARAALSKSAGDSVQQRFTVARQINAYVSWYEEILSEWHNKLAFARG